MRTMLVAAGACDVAVAQTWLPPAPPGVEVTETYGIQFSTIRDAGNPPCVEYERVPPDFEDPFDRSRYQWPFGSVNYIYRIARSELNTEQWMEFLNAFSGAHEREWFDEAANADYRFFAYGPVYWGAFRRENPNGSGYVWTLYDAPYAARVPITTLTLKQAMMYCNWLHNGKGSDWASLVDGAYDIAQVPPLGYFFTRPIQRRLGARVWIPSTDEWVKAAHFDPNRFGEGLPGYWEYSPRRTAPLVYAPDDEEGEAAAGFVYFTDELGEPRLSTVFPTASYRSIQSAYGLLDTAGCASEMTETMLELLLGDPDSGYWEQIVEGSFAGYAAQDGGVSQWPLRADHLGYFTASATWNGSLRIAASAPCIADFNDDGFVDLFDYHDFILCFEDGRCAPGKSADVDGNGTLDLFDHADFVARFESGC